MCRPIGLDCCHPASSGNLNRNMSTLSTKRSFGPLGYTCIFFSSNWWRYGFYCFIVSVNRNYSHSHTAYAFFFYFAKILSKIVIGMWQLLNEYMTKAYCKERLRCKTSITENSRIKLRQHHKHTFIVSRQTETDAGALLSFVHPPVHHM